MSTSRRLPTQQRQAPTRSSCLPRARLRPQEFPKNGADRAVLNRRTNVWSLTHSTFRSARTGMSYRRLRRLEGQAVRVRGIVRPSPVSPSKSRTFRMAKSNKQGPSSYSIELWLWRSQTQIEMVLLPPRDYIGRLTTYGILCKPNPGPARHPLTQCFEIQQSGLRHGRSLGRRSPVDNAKAGWL